MENIFSLPGVSNFIHKNKQNIHISFDAAQYKYVINAISTIQDIPIMMNDGFPVFDLRLLNYNYSLDGKVSFPIGSHVNYYNLAQREPMSLNEW